ncbi:MULTISPECIES: aminoglycoside phosphotransferase family protein [unclassified Fusibacter]|uniref:aminoglycoside phosphotransferase family protein n=1 Tax=unclassified Fusibacter TaxID=2624464 RepID=UPI0010101E93|nr:MULTISPECIES: aminoglycoside phosphotransferase family protein [unclassified Fusibacter]MCK8059502.1 aminoglycoside phosphotransferase family protein [Fusibacter sp. A2]NPE21034.1 aminoglycoside phosphotransferase family protein [Fusibacter sp. A1]RXV62308.1 aminoglycoside phosphotransferase family protein [Fusibacter sp. A1]
MGNDQYRLDFKALSYALGFGELLTEPERICGGLLHRMYRVETASATYAVKALNPQVMKRKPAMGHYLFSEKVTKLCLENGIKALPALVVAEKAMHEIGGQHYMVFDWFEGRAVNELNIDHRRCLVMGEELAKIHLLDMGDLASEYDSGKDDFCESDWAAYALKSGGHSWHQAYLEQVEVLKLLQKRVNQAQKNLEKNQVVSHRDLDPKNVLWDKCQNPMLIDWEAAGLVNPTVELIEVALSWSMTEDDGFIKENFQAVLEAYGRCGAKIKDDIEDALYAACDGKLGWLEYSLRRALGIEASDKDEMELGASEVVSTLKSIVNHMKWIPTLKGWISKSVLRAK